MGDKYGSSFIAEFIPDKYVYVPTEIYEKIIPVTDLSVEQNKTRKRKGFFGKKENEQIQKGYCRRYKKEKVFEENQQHLKDKYNMTGEAVVIVEKNNLLKYLIKYGVALIRLVVTIAILVLATLGVLTIVYPNSRHELLFVLEDIYSQMCVYLPFLSSLR